MKKQLYIGSFFALILSTILLAASGTPNTIRVLTDATGALLVKSTSQTLPLSQPTVFSNTRLLTDASNNLQVVLTGTVTPTFPLLAPTSTDCTAPPYSFTGRTTTGLNSQAANTWNLCGGGTLGLSGNTTTVTSSLQFLFPDGTAANPAMSFTSQGIGFFRAGSSIVAYSGDGTNQNIMFSNSGLFIGQTLPLGFGPVASADTKLFRTAANQIGWGGTTAAFPSIKRNVTALNFRLADDSGDAPIAFSTSTASVSSISPILQGSGTGVTVANVGANSCGTSTATIAGNQISGVITVGTVAGTQCRLTFTTAAPVARDCTVTDSTTTIATRAAAVDASNTDLFGAFVAGDKVTYVCTVR